MERTDDEVFTLGENAAGKTSDVFEKSSKLGVRPSILAF
jgi:hypothetical protein